MNKEYLLLQTHSERWQRRNFSRAIALVVMVLSLLTFAKSALGQKPDQWHGLILDQSTPDDAVTALGKPAKDQMNQQLRIFGGVSHWLTKRQKEKIFRVLEFKLGDAGVQKAFLYFLDDKLVRMMLDLKSGTVSPNGLSNIYGVSFFPMVGSMDLAMYSRNYEQNQGKIYPKTYPTVYYLVAVSERSFVSVMIGNVPSMFGALGKSMGVPDEPNSFPGKVEYVDLISRTLENKDGAEILK